MQILFMSPEDTFFFDIIAWIVFHLSIGFLCSRIPLDRIHPEKIWFQTFKWEKGGEIYERIFHVRSWKKWIPNGSGLYPDGFSIKNLPDFDVKTIERWLKETCRAEICHWLMILPGFLFFLWNSVEVGWGMVVYAVINNLVPIVMQRFNRPRLRMILRHLQLSLSRQNTVPAKNQVEPVYSI
jgi:glycosyl-4,4'-diaponeurosporenoate acyltransferase